MSKFHQNPKIMQTTALEKLSSIDAQAILDRLPDDLRSVVDHRIKSALIDRANEIEYPIEMVVEMAFTKCL